MRWRSRVLDVIARFPLVAEIREADRADYDRSLRKVGLQRDAERRVTDQLASQAGITSVGLEWMRSMALRHVEQERCDAEFRVLTAGLADVSEVEL